MKTIKLKESDIQHIVKRVLKEETSLSNDISSKKSDDKFKKILIASGIPMDTTISQTGNNVKIYSHSSGKKGGTYTVDAVFAHPDIPDWLSGTKSLDVLVASLNNNTFTITFKVIYGGGKFIEPIIEKQEAEMAKVGTTYEYNKKGRWESDEITFNLDLIKNYDFRRGIRDAIEGEKEIDLINYPKDGFKLTMSLS